MENTSIKELLKEGNQRFVSDQTVGKLRDGNRRSELTSGQAPHTIVLSCADSRVVPEVAFDMGLGELFVVRVAGNIANTSSLASIEYAVAHCGSKLIVVLGHQSCGAVTAAINGGDNGYSLNHLLSHITPAINAAPEGSSIDDVVKVNAQLNAKELMERSSIIKNAVENEGVEIVSAYYHLDTGAITFL